jgi:hypothetical protein
MDSEVAVLKNVKDIFLITSILFVWFKTDFLYSYLKLLGIHSEKYEEARLEVDISLIEYISASRKNRVTDFFFQLFSCPFCLNFWVCAVFSIENYSNFGVFYIFSLSIFGVMCKIFNND